MRSYPREPGASRFSFLAVPRVMWLLAAATWLLAATWSTSWAAPPTDPKGLATQARQLSPAAAGQVSESDDEDRPRPLKPKTPRDEAAEDRVESAASYAHARLLQNREDYTGALRAYQRAWRYDRASLSALEEIVPLAAELQRHHEAARYAALEEKATIADLALLMRMAAFLSEERDWANAARVYQKIVQIRQEAAPDFTSAMVRLELGRLLFLLDRPLEAAREFGAAREAIDQPEKFGLSQQLRDLLLEDPERTYELFAETFLQAKRFDEALDMYARVNKLRPNPPLHAFHLARVEAEQGKTDAALQSLQPYFDANLVVAGGDPYELLAQVLLRARKDPAIARRETLDRLAKLHAKFPENPSLYLAYARQLLAAEDWPAAEKAFGELSSQDASDESYLGWRDALVPQKRWDELLRVLAKYVREDLGGEAELVEPLARDPQIVDALLSRVKSASANADAPLAGGAYAAALIAVSAKRYEDADRLFGWAVDEKVPLPAPLYLEWTQLMIQADQPARAEKALRRALAERRNWAKRSDADDEPLWRYFLALALELQGKTDDALAEARVALANDLSGVEGAGNPQFEIRMAWILYHAKRYAEAEQRYVKLVRRFDAAAPTPSVRAAARESRLVLSHLCVLTGRVPEAIEWIEQVLDEFPEDISAHNDLGYLWADQGLRLERALAMCRKAVAAEPENRSYRDSLGWALYRLGRYPEALAELEIAAQDEEPDGVILDHLGDVQVKLGRPDAARESWRRAIAEFERDKEEEKKAVTQRKLDQLGKD
ncbi:MAG: tetratricopeptide repeat protein [Pirellulales bacterium]